MPNEYGDYQTPKDLTDIVTKLMNQSDVQYENVVEPTFGDGSFIQAVINNMDNVKSIRGLEIQEDHYSNAKKNIKNNTNIHIDLKLGDIFNGVDNLIDKGTSNLVIGNLPWVTSSQLSRMNSSNIPRKNNINHLSGLDALTGKANFDISEYILILFMNKLMSINHPSTIAVLVKDSTIKNIVEQIPTSNIRPYKIKVYGFDAKKYFNVNVSASLVVIEFNHLKMESAKTASVYSLDNPEQELYRYGWVGDNFVSNVKKYDEYMQYDSSSDFDWRSGLKHDASDVLVLTKSENGFVNGLKENVDIEPDLIYPLVKGSHVSKEKVADKYKNYVIVTQTKIGENTSYIKDKYPLTWNYLNDNRAVFDNRRSSIYKDKGDFSIFGIGNYSFKPYKVAIAGMYKKPYFSVLCPENGKAPMTDDTVYFVSFESKIDAIIFAAVLNSNPTEKLLESLTFNSAKRPYTKKVLSRIDVLSILNNLNIEELNSYAFEKITSNDIETFKSKFARLTLF